MNFFLFTNIGLLFWAIFKVAEVYQLEEILLNVVITQESSSCDQTTNPNQLFLKLF